MIGFSLVKLVPIFGSTLGFISIPVLAGAFTHAWGQVLVLHFEAGGTLLDFDAAKMRAYFKQEFEKAKHSLAQKTAEANKANPKSI